MRRPSPLRPLAATLALACGLRAQEPPRFEAGLEERVRLEDYDDIIDHNAANPSDSKSYYRFRTRAWITAHPSSDLEIAVGLCSENRKIVHPDVPVNAREVFFDTCYLDYRFSPAWSLRVGRQNLQRGEGFVLFDGGAVDGSRSAYFNALDLAFAWGRSRLELLAIADPSKDKYLPRIDEADGPGEAPQRLNERDEQALGLYYTGKEWAGTTLEAYWFLKTERRDIRTASNPLFQPDRRVHTLGGRLVRELGEGWTASGEFAGQWGSQDGRPGTAEPAKDLAAWGGYARVKKAVDCPWKPSFSLAYIALSGQSPRSSRITAWDPLFSRWPRWSELYIYAQVPEAGVAYATNTGMWEAEARLAPLKALELRATWYRMAAREAPGPIPGPIFGTGKERGDLLQLRADYAFCQGLKGHALYEHLAPGNFYAFRDGGHFLRVELAYQFRKRF